MSRQCLDALRFVGATLYAQEANTFSPENPSAAYRRAYGLSLFKIAMLEATEFPMLKLLREAFPRLRLGITNLSDAPPSDSKLMYL
jgi:hypothetical protein